VSAASEPLPEQRLVLGESGHPVIGLRQLCLVLRAVEPDGFNERADGVPLLVPVLPPEVRLRHFARTHVQRGGNRPARQVTALTADEERYPSRVQVGSRTPPQESLNGRRVLGPPGAVQLGDEVALAVRRPQQRYAVDDEIQEVRPKVTGHPAVYHVVGVDRWLKAQRRQCRGHYSSIGA
jgi:hypothetical protein